MLESNAIHQMDQRAILNVKLLEFHPIAATVFEKVKNSVSLQALSSAMMIANLFPTVEMASLQALKSANLPTQ